MPECCDQPCYQGASCEQKYVKVLVAPYGTTTDNMADQCTTLGAGWELVVNISTNGYNPKKADCACLALPDLTWVYEWGWGGSGTQGGVYYYYRKWDCVNHRAQRATDSNNGVNVRGLNIVCAKK
jgi:hypothetical protein